MHNNESITIWVIFMQDLKIMVVKNCFQVTPKKEEIFQFMLLPTQVTTRQVLILYRSITE